MAREDALHNAGWKRRASAGQLGHGVLCRRAPAGLAYAAGAGRCDNSFHGAGAQGGRGEPQGRARGRAPVCAGRLRETHRRAAPGDPAGAGPAAAATTCDPRRPRPTRRRTGLKGITVSVELTHPSFRHGIHPDEHKLATEHLKIERMPFTGRYILLLSQHTGAPAKAVVRRGQKVRRGQLVAEPGGFVSMALHSPVTGTVKTVAAHRHPNGQLTPAVEIEADPFATQRFQPQPPLDWRAMSGKEFADHVQRAGLVGMGGAAFPTHVKYAVPEGKRVRRLVVNGCECEPFLTCDHRLMVERAEAIARGIQIVTEKLDVEETVVGIEDNKADAAEALRAAIGDNDRVKVKLLKVKYPQGAEKMLIKAIYGIEVPAGKLPLDVEIVVNNVGTMASLADYFDRGKPLVERPLTVSGPGVVRPANLMVPIGTSVRDVLDHCGGLTEETRLVVMGGPMMGMPLASLDVPVLKGTSGILAFTEIETHYPTEYACVRCGRCLDACPNFLNPSRLGRLAKAGRYEEMERSFVMDCMECGSCSFACPSNIPIIQLIRVAKSALRERKSQRKTK
ncbi:MAG: electron transport complex subunit RsxC [Candidatus Eisenbacteria bacterium]|nr:electron transport complex subunit RsxC [Candidatus Eisenbacteria bacterium]